MSTERFEEIKAKLQGTLIVSCQAEEGFPLNKPEHIVALASSAVMGGASAIRASGPHNIRAVRKATDVPIIGIYKKVYPDSEILITPTINEVEAIVDAGSDIVALDATNRLRPDGDTFPQLYREVRNRWDVPIMADVSTFDEGYAAWELGVDIVSTTLSGYRAYSPQQEAPDLDLVRKLSEQLSIPVIAEGRIAGPDDVRAALDYGAFAVVVGSMITRPHLITKHFAGGLEKPEPSGRVLALDIGGTKIAGGVVDQDGSILVKKKIPTPSGGGPEILEQSAQLLKELRNQHTGNLIASIGISTGGQIDRRGEIVGATDMLPNWVGFGLRKGIEEQFDLPTVVLNDGHAAAFAEHKLGAGRGVQSMLCVVIGTGLGGGLILDGEIQHGSHGLAGSIGQMKASIDGEEYISLEKIVSGPGLLNLYNNSIDKDKSATSPEDVAERAIKGEALAHEAIERIGTYLGLGLSHALHTYDVDCIVVGGSVAQIGEPLFDSTRGALSKYGYSTIADTPIRVAELGPNAGMIGAALWAIKIQNTVN
ncbi:MAG: ROK family protein [Chloroflexi bacterium]|nr:MAG: ROK family protein [Chloroflexota bacterium]MBL1192973.1 ROK family protein [Chloroflexota bacterium]NOH10265.1 putative N-acetylmannosamine-6-phosphate 2-epimerase [Chloroflexota bacterium]